jgi:hypothetical protein
VVGLLRATPPLHRGDPLDLALELFVENNLLELPVVDETPHRRVIGIVTRADVSGTYLRHVHGIRNLVRAANVSPITLGLQRWFKRPNASRLPSGQVRFPGSRRAGQGIGVEESSANS